MKCSIFLSHVVGPEAAALSSAARCLDSCDVDGDLNSCTLEEGMEDDGVILASLNSFAE